MTRSRYRFLGTDAPYFLTMTVNNWLPVFTRPETVDVVFDGWRYLREHRGFSVNGYVILEFKRRYKTGSTYQVWEEGSHPQRIDREEVMRQKLEYLHFNPVKRGYVDEPEHWRWSSARNCAGEVGVFEVETDWL